MKEKKERKYNPVTVTALTIIPIVGIFGTFWYGINNGVVWQEPVIMFSFWIISGLGITVGYHRLFSHCSFKAHPLVEWVMAIFGASALENSALKWCSDHRRHHTHLDTDKDPYSITKGFFHAHMGWILKNNAQPIKKVHDLEAKPALRFQHKYYLPMFAVFSIGLPVALGTIWGRPLGALFWGVFLRLTLVHHFTYFINSLCHYVGKRPFDPESTARDSWYMALFTFGEGYHNFHHKFQWDYRNGIKWFHFDPGKWCIWLLAKMGLARELKFADHSKVMKAKVLAVWDQLNNRLEDLPEQAKVTYSEKLTEAREKIQQLEISWRKAEEDAKEFFTDKKERLLSRRTLKEKKKMFHFEYQALLQSMTILLVAVQNGQY